MTETNGARGRWRCGRAELSLPSFSRSTENAFFGSRSRVTIPKAQSVISCSPVNHSSVQVKKIVPARPHFTTLSTCQLSISACSSWESRILPLRMPDRGHAEFAQNERPFFSQILQSQQVFLKVALVVQVNVEAEKIDILR